MSRTILQPETIESDRGSGRWQVVIFNNDHTAINEVIEILICATGCGLEEASLETWEAHTFGKAPVHFSSRDECEIVAAMISSAQIRTEISREWKD